MSASLARLMGMTEQECSKVTASLEKVTGHLSIDNQLLGSLHSSAITIGRELGLEKGFTADELFFACKSRAESIEKLLWSDKHILEDAVECIVSKTNSSLAESSLLSVRKTALTVLLKSLPPKNLLKQTGYKTLSSLLKHMSIYEVVAWSKIVEPKSWHVQWQKKCSKLDMRSFELKPLKVIQLSPLFTVNKKPISFKSLAILPIFETGNVAVVLPVNSTPQKGLLLLIYFLIQEVVSELMSTGIYLRLKRTSSNFALFASNIFSGSMISSIAISPNLSLEWDILLYCLESYNRDDLSEALQAYFSTKDLVDWDSCSVLEDICGSEIILPFKKGWNAYLIHDKVITLNLKDYAKVLYYNYSEYMHEYSCCSSEIYKEYIRRYSVHEPFKSMLIEAIDSFTEIME